MGSRRRRIGSAAAALIAIGLIAAATAAAAGAPIRAMRITGSSEIKAAVPYGRSRVLLLGAGKSGGTITRVRLNGSTDRSFGDEGVVHVEADDVAIAADGKILVASTRIGDGSLGSRGTEARVTRLLPGGKVDHSFGHGGSADVRFGAHGYGQAVAVAADGDILLGGVRIDNPNSTYFTEADLGVARLLPNGTLDHSFGHRGVSIIRVGDEIEAMDLAPTPSGGVVVEEGNSIDAYLEKLGPDGSPDRHFGHGGGVTIEGRRGKSGAAQLLLPAPGFAVLPSGKILVAASGLVRSGPTQGLVGRYRADGQIDDTWGRDGWAVVPDGRGSPARGLAPLPGGVLAVGTVFSGPGARGGEDFGAVALDRSGRLDRDFATGGSCRASVPGAQGVFGVLRVGDRAVVLGRQGTTRWMLDCPPLP